MDTDSMSSATRGTEFRVVEATPDGAPIEQWHIYRDGVFVDYGLTEEQAWRIVDTLRPRCSECERIIYGSPYPCQTCRGCFTLLDGPYDEDEEDV